MKSSVSASNCIKVESMFLHYHGLLRARWSLLYQKRKSREWFAGTVADQRVVGWRSWRQRSAHRMWLGALETDCRRLSLSAVKTIQQLLHVQVLGKEGTRIIIKKIDNLSVIVILFLMSTEFILMYTVSKNTFFPTDLLRNMTYSVWWSIKSIVHQIINHSDASINTIYSKECLSWVHTNRFINNISL